MEQNTSFLLCGGCDLLSIRHSVVVLVGAAMHGRGDNNFEVKSSCIFRILIIRLFKTVGLVLNPTAIFYIVLYLNGSDQYMYVSYLI